MILNSIKKEVLLIFSDIHSLAVLLVMPLVFMVIMTLALAETDSDIAKKITFYASLEEHNDAQKLFVSYLNNSGLETAPLDIASVKISFMPELQESLFSDFEKSIALQFKLNTAPQIRQSAIQTCKIALAKLKLHLYLLELGELSSDMSVDEQILQVSERADTDKKISVINENQRTNVTEYSIPSWLIFGVFFIVFPISVTLLNEIKCGTLLRLKTFPINLNHYFLFKLLSYLHISFIQFILLSLVGLFLVPPLVGLPSYPLAALIQLLPVMLIVCASAICFGAIFATLVKSYEQAIVLGGGTNIILAAISGFMVPLEIMPESMRLIANFSPMYWCSILVRDVMNSGTASYSFMNFLYLIVFMMVCLGIALFLFNNRARKLTWS